MESVSKNAERWGVFYSKGTGNAYPDENIVRLIRGQYGYMPRSGRALDVGFGRGGNLLFLAKSGFEAHGLEVSPVSVAAGDELARAEGVELNLGLLTGTDLPYPDEHFDLVVSWAAVYYYGNRTLVARAIEEFRRVLKPGGVLLLEVPHPHSPLAGRLSTDLGDGAHRIDRESPHDTRFGLEIFYEGTSSGWRRLLAGFDNIEEGYAEMDLFIPERRDAWRLFRVTKGTPAG